MSGVEIVTNITMIASKIRPDTGYCKPMNTEFIPYPLSAS
jgi:hypothetical protein